MEILSGIAVSPGVAISPAYVFGRRHLVIPVEPGRQGDVDTEVSRLRDAVATASRRIRELKTRLGGTAVDKYAGILDAHLAILNDERLLSAIVARIREEGLTAEHAAGRVLSEYARTLESVDNVYLSQRATDIYDIQERLLAAFLGTQERAIEQQPRPVAIIAHDLTPTETLSLDKGKVSGFATDAGGSTSHTAIVAKALEIPAVVGLGRATSAVSGGDTVIIDGNAGLLIVNPDPVTIERYRTSRARRIAADVGLEAVRDLAAETADGRRVLLMANIELPDEVPTALANGADGIGLFRTEFMFMKAGHEPTEEEQFAVYSATARALGERPLVIRTFDLGGEKFAGGVSHLPERNPSLGCRSIRFSFENPAMFRTQLRAVLRAACYGNVRLLLPMISSIEEVRRAKAYVEEVSESLERDGVEHAGTVPVGIMVEVPSVAVMADVFAREADFFSVGTNDLIQYTLAVERVNEHVAWLFTPAHPAILRLLKNVVDAGRDAGIPVSICGEMGADPVFGMFLVGAGFTEISVSPPSIPRVKQLLRSFSYETARRTALAALDLPNAGDVSEFLLNSLPPAAQPLG
jgi:phosphotransferase system enzyme I (PtsI)